MSIIIHQILVQVICLTSLLTASFTAPSTSLAGFCHPEPARYTRRVSVNYILGLYIILVMEVRHRILLKFNCERKIYFK